MSLLKTLLFLMICFRLAATEVRAQSGMTSRFDSHTSASPDHKYEVKGTLLLFEKYWPQGRIELQDNKIFQNDSLYYNYNMMDQTLLFTQDFRSMTIVQKDKFKSVTFILNDSVFVLEHVNLINTKDLFLELTKDDQKYSLYKNTLVEFRDVNYQTNGIAQDGSAYGNLIQHPIYYIVFPNKEYKKLNETDKKSILKAFKSSADKDKVESWLAGQKQISGESLIWDLINYLNN